MSQNEVVIDEQALIAVSEYIGTYIKECRENFEGSIRKLKLNTDDWNDEDFNSLLSAINSFMADVDAIGEEVAKFQTRIENKISAIHELHNMKI